LSTRSARAASGRHAAGLREPPTAQPVVGHPSGLGSGRGPASEHRPTRGEHRRRGPHAQSSGRRSWAGWATNGRRGAGWMPPPRTQAVVSRPDGRRRSSGRRLAAEGRPTWEEERQRTSRAALPRRRPGVWWTARDRRGADGFEPPTAWPLVTHQRPRPGAASGRHRRTARRVGNAGNRTSEAAPPREGLKRAGPAAARAMPTW
jgi:hypothetical protein